MSLQRAGFAKNVKSSVMQSSDVKKVSKIEDFPITKVLRLMEHCMPHINHDSEVLKWQYFGTPKSNANLYYIENDSEIISFFAMVCHQIKVGDQLLIARAAQAVMTHSEFRGMGHLHLLGKIAHEDVGRGLLVSLSQTKSRSVVLDEMNGQSYARFQLDKSIYLKQQHLVQQKKQNSG